MILFKQKDQNEQFISVFVLDGTSTVKLNEYIINEYPVLKKFFYALDEEEIIYKIAENVVYGFPLNELKQFVEKSLFHKSLLVQQLFSYRLQTEVL